MVRPKIPQPRPRVLRQAPGLDSNLRQRKRNHLPTPTNLAHSPAPVAERLPLSPAAFLLPPTNRAFRPSPIPPWFLCAPLSSMRLCVESFFHQRISQIPVIRPARFSQPFRKTLHTSKQKSIDIVSQRHYT